MLYRSTNCLCRGGAPVQNLAHSASLHVGDNNVPSNAGIKQVALEFVAEAVGLLQDSRLPCQPQGAPQAGIAIL